MPAGAKWGDASPAWVTKEPAARCCFAAHFQGRACFAQALPQVRQWQQPEYHENRVEISEHQVHLSSRMRSLEVTGSQSFGKIRLQQKGRSSTSEQMLSMHKSTSRMTEGEVKDHRHMRAQNATAALWKLFWSQWSKRPSREKAPSRGYYNSGKDLLYPPLVMLPATCDRWGGGNPQINKMPLALWNSRNSVMCSHPASHASNSLPSLSWSSIQDQIVSSLG